LSSATSAELVDALSNPKGWWRDTAQRLLVERGDTTVAPGLASLAARAPDWRTRLHALWTLDGLDRIDAASVRRALGDPNGAVRAAAVRLSERWLAADAALRGAVLALMSDRNWNVRRQVAASIGEMPERDRVDPAAAILIRDGADAIVVDAAVSSLKGIEADVLAKVIQSTPAAASPGEAVSMLAGAVAKSGDAAAVGRVIDVAADASRPQWTRAALLRGLDAGLPARGAATGRGRAASGGLPGLSVPGGRIQVTPGRGVSLSAEPAALSALAQKGGLLATLAKTVSAKLDWPGRPAPAVTVPPLTAIQQKRYDAGAQIYKNVCAGCHQEDGRGKDKLGASLIDSPLVTAADASGSIRVLLSGKDGAIGLMPPLGPAMSDEEIAAALTYIRRAWGHTASAVDPLDVMEIRALSAQSRYRAAQTGDTVELHDTRADVAVKVLAPASNAYQMTVKGQDVLRRTWASIDDIRQRMGLNGIPLLWPYANRLDEQAFYANGQKYSFDPGLGNTGRGAIPIHGFLQNTTAWKVVEVRADARSAWITAKLEFFRLPQYMKQFPFAHTLTMTYRLQDGALEVRTRIDNLSADPLPVTIGFHPYFQLTDAPRAAWRLSLVAKTHWLLDERTIPTGETQPIAKRLPDPASIAVDTAKLDDVFTDLERDAQGWSTMSLKGRNQQIDVVLGPRFKTILVYSGAAGSVALEPMAGISNAMNLAHRGVYKELQSIEPGGFWEESFWIRPRGY
jgi:aldose 1-epimerase